ncbi:class III lanthionine synthetase LanKC [Streptomyces olivoreticuli]|uniref:class III lanthionine synthetase LanKC n=1 Tax=Streptomyces olivoreticuli TaxID=68246 RepID=UPI00265B44EF|nr:class III lanthionine synthetase LanKC [Streptomyces olivoreticuli]WKK24839.1 class III lanthionine synthetase LanKC [Streptomyces olivoreticuli]
MPDHFVDSLDHLDDADSRFTCTGLPAPPGRRRAEHGGWVHLHDPAARTPRQGWKIHVSAAPDAADKAICVVWDHCVEHGLSFKFLRSAAVHLRMDSKQAPRTASGKLVTVYPADDGELERTLTALARPLRGVEGPYILSDLRWDEGPLHVRYGAFDVAYCFSADGDYVPAMEGPDGELVPDVRGTGFKVPPWVEVPPFLDARIRAARADGAARFPYRVEKALHFSNSGGVYRAVERDTGRRVVLREARPHAGLDDSGADAVARLTREHAALGLLAGLPCVPRVFARTRHWEHHYLVEEFIEGETLQEAVGRRHPLLRPDPETADPAAYTRWACDVLARTEAAVAALHGRGVVFGDLQPGNVMLRPDGSVCLVDFETAGATGEGRGPALATPGFAAPWARSGPAVDAYALGCLALALFCPLTPLLRFDDRKPEQLIAWTERRFPVPPGFGDRLRRELAPPTPVAGDGAVCDDWPRDRSAGAGAALDSLRDAILHSATPERADRLFPGDVRQFDGQAASLAFGAAGVLHALHTTGRAAHPDREAHVDWLVRADEATRWPRPGLYDGLAGVAYALDALGRCEEARGTLDRLAAFDLRGCGAGLFGGLSGIALAFLHLGRTEAALRLAGRLVRALDGEDLPGGDRIGLLHGWSGPALLFTHLHRATADPRHLRHAEAALNRDLARCGTPGGERLHVADGRRWLSTLDHGSAGIGIALHEYLRHREAPHLALARDRIRAGLADTELLLSAGLFGGQAGLLYGLAHLSGPDSAMVPHLRSLGLHAVRYGGGRAFALDGMLRLSMDLATGTAGVLLALHAALGDGSAAGSSLPLLNTGP